MLDFFTDIKNELDSKYNDATIYDNREIAKRSAENYIDDVQSRLSDYAEGDPLYKRDASATDLPCMSLVKVWVKPGAIAMYIDILSPLKEVRFLDTNVAATPS